MTVGPSRPTAPPAAAVAAVKDGVRTLLALPDDVTVMVQQLACREPGCPPLETVIAVLDGGDNHTWRLHAPVAEVTLDDLRRLLADGEDHPH